MIVQETLLVSTAPPTTEEEKPEEIIEEPEEVVEEPELEPVQFSNFFLQDGVTAKYLGEGNEYASYLARTQWHNDNTVSIYEDNGGTTLLRTYRISDESIDLIKNKE